MSGSVGPNPVPTVLLSLNVGAPTGTTNQGDVNVTGAFRVNGTPISGALTTANLALLDLRTLPTSDPGGGMMWINGGGGTAGALWVGPA